MRHDRLHVPRAGFPGFRHPLPAQAPRLIHYPSINDVEQAWTHLTETRIDGELVYDGHFLKVQRDRISLPDGKHTRVNTSAIPARS
jgi:hypothetical protein